MCFQLARLNWFWYLGIFGHIWHRRCSISYSNFEFKEMEICRPVEKLACLFLFPTSSLKKVRLTTYLQPNYLIKHGFKIIQLNQMTFHIILLFIVVFRENKLQVIPFNIVSEAAKNILNILFHTFSLKLQRRKCTCGKCGNLIRDYQDRCSLKCLNEIYCLRILLWKQNNADIDVICFVWM